MRFAEVLRVAAVQGGSAVAAPPPGETLGNELWPQPGFDATTGLTLNDWTVSGGVARDFGDFSFLVATALETLTTGDYRCVVDVVNTAPIGEFFLRIAGGGTHTTDYGVAGVHSFLITVASVADQLIQMRETSGDGIRITSLSVKKVL